MEADQIPDHIAETCLESMRLKSLHDTPQVQNWLRIKAELFIFFSRNMQNIRDMQDTHFKLSPRGKRHDWVTAPLSTRRSFTLHKPNQHKMG